MDDLIAFFRARLDEDAYYAERAGGHEFAFDSLGQLLVSNGATISKVADLGVQVSGWHIARHDPARVLREVEAKRQRLALYLGAGEALAAALKGAPALDDPATAHSYVRERVNVNQASGRFAAFEMSVRLDATAWCDHPDYRPEWKP